MHGRLGLRQQAPVASRNAYTGSSRLFAAAIPQLPKPALSSFDARQKLSGQNSSKLLDARQKLLQKTKFADARQRIEKKKLQVRNEAASDMRIKLLAKRRLATDANSNASTTAVGRALPTGTPLAKSEPMLVTVSNQGRAASTVMRDISSAGTKTIVTSAIAGSRLVS